MEPTSPQDYEPLTSPGPSRPGSNGALIAGLLTFATIGGAGGLYHWVNSRAAERPTSVSGAIEQATPTEVLPQDALPQQASPTPDLGTPPSTIVLQVARSLLNRDEWAVDTLLGKSLTKPQRGALLGAISQGTLTLDGNQPTTDLGPTAKGERWAINLRPKAATSAERLLLEFTRGESEWLLSSAQLPESLKLPEGPATSGPAGEKADAFVTTLVAGEFANLKSLVNPEQVTDEKLAALGIIFDEAKFQLKPGPNGLKTTNVSEDRAWVVAKVHSPNYQLDSEFGLELKKEGESWLIDRVNVSSLMRGFTSMTDDEDTFNSPLVNTPAGGDSLVLYFGYDNDKLTARSLKQLAIVASLLKQSSTKRIQIGGHADALGEDGYNDALSKRRAGRVAETLRSFGVRGSQINLEAFGERLPLSPNLNPDGSDNPEGRGRNRRAEIYLDF